MTRLTFLSLILLLALAALAGIAPAAAQGDGVSFYRIPGVFDVQTRSTIAATGAGIVEVGHGYVLVEATREEARALGRLGLTLEPQAFIKAFPPADSAFHDYAEMVAELQQAASDHPAIFSLFSAGLTWEGRTVWAGKVSDNVGTDEDEPEVLLTHHQHAREHLTVEQALYTLRMLTDEYGTDPQITSLVDGREIWIVFDMNPDGGEYDIATGSYRLLAQEPPAERRLERHRHRSQPQLELPLGLLRRQQRHVEQRDLPRRLALLGARDRRRARLRQQPRDRRRAADQGPDRFSQLRRAGDVALRLHLH